MRLQHQKDHTIRAPAVISLQAVERRLDTQPTAAGRNYPLLRVSTNNKSTMKNFDVYLRRAIRKEPIDWSEHYVDYDMLKEKLSTFQQRRKALGKLLQGDTQLTYEDLSLAMADSGNSDGGDYFQYVDADEERGEIWSATMGVACS